MEINNATLAGLTSKLASIGSAPGADTKRQTEDLAAGSGVGVLKDLVGLLGKDGEIDKQDINILKLFLELMSKMDNKESGAKDAMEQALGQGGSPGAAPGFGSANGSQAPPAASDSAKAEPSTTPAADSKGGDGTTQPVRADGKGEGSEAVKGEPSKGESVKSEPVKSDATKAESAKSESAKSESAKSEPAKSESAKSEPDKAESAKAESGKTEPAKTEPAKAEPAKTDSAKAEPVQAESAKSEPAKAESTKSEPAKAEPEKTEPAKTEPAKTESAKAESDKKSEAEPTKSSNQSTGRNQAEQTYDAMRKMAQDNGGISANARSALNNFAQAFGVQPDSGDDMTDVLRKMLNVALKDGSINSNEAKALSSVIGASGGQINLADGELQGMLKQAFAGMDADGTFSDQDLQTFNDLLSLKDSGLMRALGGLGDLGDLGATAPQSEMAYGGGSYNMFSNEALSQMLEPMAMNFVTGYGSGQGGIGGLLGGGTDPSGLDGSDEDSFV